MDHFLHVLIEKRVLSTTNRQLLVLNGHKAHQTLEILTKAKANGVDNPSCPHLPGLQPLDVSCFKPFKVAFRAYKNAWCIKNNGARVKKEDLTS